jgi:hypothetical protein
MVDRVTTVIKTEAREEYNASEMIEKVRKVLR